MTRAQAELTGRCAEHLGALAGVPAPLAYVDLDALERNARAMLQQAGTQPVRVASKSLRCTALIHHALGLSPRFQGVMAFTVREALHLADQGINDILIAYPSVDTEALAQLAERAREQPTQVIRPIVDALEQVALVSQAAQAAGVELAVCVDIDAGFQPLGERGPTLGPKRSSLRTPEQVVQLVRQISDLAGVRVDALMAYDGQIAGIGDQPPGKRLMGQAIGLMQRRSLAELKDRVPRVVAAVRRELESRGGALTLVNVGGTGSLSRMNGVAGATELAAGSGFYAPTLFDTYSRLSLTPAAFFVLPVVRLPVPGKVATVLGGGYPASGAAGPDRSPTPVHPPGLTLDANEGAGEVQTPLLGAGTERLAIGDRVVFRHTKAGELCERFDRLHLLRAGAIVDVVPTYRGEGLTFL